MHYRISGLFLQACRRAAGCQTLALMAAMVGGLNIASVRADETLVQDEMSGTLEVYGSLTESACRLEMESLHQTIELGNTDSAKLLHPGDRATPVTFKLMLKECVRGRSAVRDPRTGALTWSSMQPAVSVYFSGNSDADVPEYVQVKGTGGLALRLSDSHGRLLPLNQRAIPLLLSPGQDQLSWTVTPVRTPAPLQAGPYHASVDFRMIYD